MKHPKHSHIRPFSRGVHAIMVLCLLWGIVQFPHAQVIEVLPVFPKVDDDITVTFNAAEGNGALLGVSPVYAHAGLITSASTTPTDWKHVQGVWGTPDAKVLMQSLGNNRHSLSYNIRSYYGVTAGEEVDSLAFVFRNANGSIVGRASDGQDIYYPVYPDNVAFLSLLLSPLQASLALFENEVLPVKGATSQNAELYLIDNDDTLATAFGNLITHDLHVTIAGNHTVRFVAINGADTLVKSFFYTVIVSVVTEDPPTGREDGLTLVDDTTAYFQLFAPGKSFVHLIGDATSWELRSDYQMKRSVNGNTWWIEVHGLQPGAKYQYQYVFDGTIRIGDPYSTLILDPWNDGAISQETYPDMPVYPFGLTSGNVSSFVNAPVPTTSPLQPKLPKSDLVIYELLLRDFLAAHSFQVLRDTLDYLQRMGINAIELMPVNEFEGNYGWGYNPDYHMALDKFYGPADTFRQLVEECHARGMAIILDVVYNHAFSQSPFAQMYWDAAQNRPAANNPWLNPVAKHDFNVGYDFNHESAATKYFVKRVLSWWMTTYGIDGFRFDLSKGFTQNNTLGNIAAWGHYDQSRINILQEYADHVWSIDPEAYVILEHFADNDEEKELASRGMMLWGNMTGVFSQASMGYGGSDLSNTWHVQRGWDEPHLIGFMESHDEERIMFKNLNSGNSAPGYSIRDLPVALRRMELVSTFLLLFPGPKMIWEFGELGYEYPINYCVDGTINTSCRLDPKPIRWDYQQVDRRQRIYDIIRAINTLRRQTAWKEGAFDMNVANQFEKKVHFQHADMDIAAAGNFYIGVRSLSPGFTRTGWWYDYLEGDSLWVSSLDTVISYLPGEYHVYTTKKIDPGFEITTSIQPAPMQPKPLVITPSPNTGEFRIAIPADRAGIPDLEIINVSGLVIPAVLSREADAWRVNITAAVPGMYVVRLLFPEDIYIGKMVLRN